MYLKGGSFLVEKYLDIFKRLKFNKEFFSNSNYSKHHTSKIKYHFRKG
jgi:hypothetical protein